VHPGWPSLSTLDRPPNNLPTQLSSFVGREEELATLRRLLRTSRLLTLTGSGGSGKTRLSVQLAAEAIRQFPDGVCFVPLAPIRSAELVPSSIAHNLGLQDSSDRPLIERLLTQLRERELLLVLDNFEQLLAAASVVADILKGTHAVRIIVSSRAPLHLTGEQEFPVPPLKLPDAEAPPTAASVAGCEAVRLFAERAAAAVPGFTINERNAASIAEIARRLDGLPLAIELAAARIKLLPPEAMLPRLENSLGLLVGGARDLPSRQQTLRGTIAWSYELLSEGARRLLAACSVFRGGASLGGIESVCSTAVDIGVDVLDGLAELVDQSLVRRVEGDISPRFMMLETIREYAAERLAEMPETARVRQAHAATFLAMTDDARLGLTGPAEKDWLARLEVEHNNVRAAIDWCRQKSPSDALRLAASMCFFWNMRGHYTEGRARLSALLEEVTDAAPPRVGALNAAATLAIDQGDYPDAFDKVHESLELSRKLNDKQGEGTAALYCGRAYIADGHPAEAAQYVEKGMTLLREVDDSVGVAYAFLYGGLAASFVGRLGEACEAFSQGVGVCRELGFRSLGARALQMLGHSRIELGDLRGAREALEEALPVSIDLGDRWVVPLELSGFAGLAAKTGRPRQALRLAGAAEACSQNGDFRVPSVMQNRLERWLAPARNALAREAEKMFLEGKAMSLMEAVASALANEPEHTRRNSSHQQLTKRELEIATLVAHGLTNRDIAGRLHLSVRTVEVHVDHVLTKLGFNNRTQLAAWAYEEKLLAENT
jgi:predicted ATPase/DNA-binding CsgD family transcriptional regulator